MDDVTDEKLADAVRESASALNGTILNARGHGLHCAVRTLDFEDVRGTTTMVEVSVSRPL